MQESYTDWILVSLSPFGLPTIVLVTVLATIATALVLWSYREAKTRWRLMLTRMLGLILVLGFFTEPALQLRVVRKIQNRLAIVVDRSRSMTLTTDGTQSRYAAMQAWLQQDPKGFADLSQSYAIDWYDLDGPMVPASLKDSPKAETTDLVKALENTRTTGAAKPLAGIMLLSDGADNAGSEGPQHGALAAAAAERLSRLGAPVNAISITSSSFRDISIADVRADEFAFVHNTFEVEVALDVAGFSGVTLPVTLKRDGQPVTSQNVALEKDGTARVTIKSKPDKIGEFVYSVSIPVLAGEAIAENNESSFVVTVIRDKIRVLHVAGRPSWDERFLRQLLKENPNVDLISFFILRTPTDGTAAPESELSLIPFPVDKLFTTELASFDVVILQNFDYRPYRMAQYLANIRDAVRNSGLGLVMIGGDESFTDGGYAGTAVAEVLPVALDQGGLITGTLRATLTPSGRGHPVTDLSHGTGNNDALWSHLAPLGAINRTGSLLDGATALVVCPEAPTSSRSAPVIAVTDAGLGRSLAIATDNTWRWRFSSSRDGGASERAYYRFWSNALRWLVRDPEHARVRVSLTQRRVETGAPVEAKLSVLDNNYAPIDGASVSVTLTRSGAGALSQDSAVTSDGGQARLQYNDLPPGAYRISAVASLGEKRLGEGQAALVVESHSAELSHSAPRPDLMQAIAQATLGRHLTLEDATFHELKLENPDVVEVDRRRNVELWDNAWALVAGVVLLVLDWAMRRRRGYV